MEPSKSCIIAIKLKVENKKEYFLRAILCVYQLWDVECTVQSPPEILIRGIDWKLNMFI